MICGVTRIASYPSAVPNEIPLSIHEFIDDLRCHVSERHSAGGPRDTKTNMLLFLKSRTFYNKLQRNV